MNKSRITRNSMFALLYFSQGAIMGYFTALNALYLLSFGLSMSQVGIMGAIVMLPFVLKIFLGMLSDHVNLLGLGHRKPYIVLGLLVQAVCILLIIFVNPAQQYWLFVFLAFILQIGMALYDTCTDGLALDITPAEDEGTVQGFMVGGRALGVVSVGLISLVVQQTSWTLAFILLAGLTLLPLPLVLLTEREAERPLERNFEWGAFRAFAKRSVVALALLGALYSLVTNGANELVNPFLQQEYGIGVAFAGWITTAWGLGVAVGGFTGGRLTDVLGHRRSLLGAVMVGLAGILVLAAIYNPLIAWLLVPLFGLAYGYYETVYFAMSMRFTDPRIAASMFAILMAIANIGTGIGLGVSGVLADVLGFRWTFIIMGLLNVLAIPLLPLIFEKKNENAG